MFKGKYLHIIEKLSTIAGISRSKYVRNKITWYKKSWSTLLKVFKEAV